jgi:hypothetical protein
MTIFNAQSKTVDDYGAIEVSCVHKTNCVWRKNMFPSNDLGASLYKSWNDAQRREEIARLVEGYRNGLPVGILCKMVETVAGSRTRARKHLHALMTPEERQTAINKETGGVQIVAKELLQ